jgi:REP element-mobilizing transposase RayT
MKFDPNIHHRRSIRLAGYDYTLPGAYFVTIDTWNREHLLGTVVAGVMHLSHLGNIVHQAWDDLPTHYPNVVLDACCIMPDHIHGIIVLQDMRRGGSVGQIAEPDRPISGTLPPPAKALTRPGMDSNTPSSATPRPSLTGSPPSSAPTPPSPARAAQKPHGLPEIVRGFKTFSARRINHVRGSPGAPVWQRNYYEHILRGEDEWQSIRTYIQNNPAEWQEGNA